MQQSPELLTMLSKDNIHKLLERRNQFLAVGRSITVFLPAECADGRGDKFKNATFGVVTRIQSITFSHADVAEAVNVDILLEKVEVDLPDTWERFMVLEKLKITISLDSEMLPEDKLDIAAVAINRDSDGYYKFSGVNFSC